ncbi:MAG: L-threonylcarbamoyladenylate synthase [Spirochaetaceae bacterium]|jgi:tRNA threonylcarbamoyl adenosine modification protein (Sua5/YciO/YrdC/YwlC family)|nr:L-threonylcarbamoyladenylate synthase [Spirochaetaceae bacterium]
MIEYVVPENIDDRVVAKAARILKAGGLVALPTDTSWALVCSMRSKEGIKRMRRLSGERDERRFTLLCSDVSQFGAVCSIDNRRFRLIKKLSPGPYVFVLQTLHGTDKLLSLRRCELGVRIPDNAVPCAVVDALGAPLYSITAKRSMARRPGGGGAPDVGAPEGGGGGVEEPPPIPEDELFEGGWELEDIDGLDLILDGGEDMPLRLSTILDLTDDEARVIRQGAGVFPL